MIDAATFTIEHITEVRNSTKRDPALIDKSIFALGLLEALARSGLPFIFKGGSSLLLLLENPRRFSTDIDIIVEPDTDVDGYLEVASNIWPFIKKAEHIRKPSTNIEKQHFKYTYFSPQEQRDQTILLDIVFENNPYKTIIRRSIENELLITGGRKTHVSIPSADNIIADKLTAFAPHTTGIPFGIGKELEIIKQLYDVTSLLEYARDFSELKETFHNIATVESEYRNLKTKSEDVLHDCIDASATIAGRGLLNKEEYPLLLKGIRNIRGHIFSEAFTGDVAAQRACMAMYVAAAVLTNQPELPVLRDDSYYMEISFPKSKYQKLSYIKKMSLDAYKYLVEAVLMLGE